MSEKTKQLQRSGGAAPAFRSRWFWASVGVVASLIGFTALPGGPPATASRRPGLFPQPGFFNRVATFDVRGEVAEIVAATPDGRTLIYTDSDEQELGFVDITDPTAPRAITELSFAGEPTSVAVTPNGRWALVVAHDPDQLVVLDLSDRSVETTLALGGQPDAVAVSPDGRYAAIAIENERDEDVNQGRMPQGPPGFLTIVDLVGEPGAWTKREVSLVGVADRFSEDPEPENVDIDARNLAAVTLQENNHVVIVRLADGRIVADWSAGATSHLADTTRDNDIRFDDPLANARREPDAIAWTPFGRLITANEGDYDLDLDSGQFVGGRDFTIFEPDGRVLFEPGAGLELEAVRHGHYPDSRSGRKGTEIEGVEIGVYGLHPFAFVGSERGNFVAVYGLYSERRPVFHQLLPTGAGPEGLLAIPRRGLFVTADEEEGTISIFRLESAARAPQYPHVFSATVPWSAISGLAAGPGTQLYAVPDSAFRPSRIFRATLDGERAVIHDAIPVAKNYDLEGIALRPGGGWWVVSEGAGNAGASGATKNLLVRLNPDGTVAQEVELPAAINAAQRQFGYEGVATSADGSQVYVALQREWADDPAGRVKIGRYTPATGEWRFFHYPLDPAPAGGWVGLSELVRIDDNTFAVLERDNQQREQARVKRIYRFSVAGLTPAPAGAVPPLVTKTLVRDLLVQDAWLLEKAEGMTLLPSGRTLVASDNDGAGETRLLELALSY